MIRLFALAGLALSACSGGTTGTVAVEIVTSPGSQLLDAVQTLRMTLTNPRQVTETTRSGTGFALALEFDSVGASGGVILEGLDASGALIACGQSPVFPVSAINSTVVVFMAPPLSMTVSPAALDVPRSEVSGTPLTYGAVLAGGRDASGAPSSAIAIYNAYLHSMVSGIALPAARAGVAMATGSNGGIYLFGGTGADANPAGTLWWFDTTVAPSGAYMTIADQPQLARTGQLMVAVGSDDFLITGTPALAASSTTVAARTDIDSLPKTGAAATHSDGTVTAIFVGDQIVRYHNSVFDVLAGTGRTGGTAATLPDGRIIVVGGDPASRDVLVIDSTGAVTTLTDALAVPRVRPAVAATTRYVVVDSGTDDTGAVLASAEILDVQTLATLVTLPAIARADAYAVALATDQVLVVGGAPAASQLELFTPDPPPAP
jgi:hypothetical protein